MGKNSGNPKYMGLSGKIGGLAVKGMIQEVEQQMAAGRHISAAPGSREEADLLHAVRHENAESAKRAGIQ